MNRYCNRCFLFFIGVLLLYSCKKKDLGYSIPKPIAIHANGMEYIGMETCMECHAAIVADHMQTAHWLTSSLASEATIKGSLEKDENVFTLSETTVFHMYQKDSLFVQEPRFTTDDRPIYTQPMNVVIGSGTKGQSYLTWNKDALFQLQISYFSPTDNWINSPGYLSGRLAPPRPVPGRCLECHTTYAEHPADDQQGNRFKKENIVWGIDCQRCHGPVVDHVKHHKNSPLDTIGRSILKYAQLSKQQRLDACALCHSGLREQTTEGHFAFAVGDSLQRFSVPDYDASSLENLDVHGNQYGLLQASKCFKMSDLMDCTTCHNPHKKDRDNLKLFNQICMDCHNGRQEQVDCKVPQDRMLAMGNNCVQCHMPLGDSNTMQIQVTADSIIPVNVRTHLIGVYK